MLVFRNTSYVVIAFFAALLGYQALQIQGTAKSYPLVLVVLVSLGAVTSLMVETVNRRTISQPPGDVRHLMSARGRQLVRLAAFSVLWVGYPAAMPFIGFILATIVALSVSLWLLEFRHILATVGGAVVFALVLSILFATVFYIPMPAGPIDTWLTELLFRLQG